VRNERDGADDSSLDQDRCQRRKVDCSATYWRLVPPCRRTLRQATFDAGALRYLQKHLALLVCRLDRTNRAPHLTAQLTASPDGAPLFMHHARVFLPTQALSLNSWQAIYPGWMVRNGTQVWVLDVYGCVRMPSVPPESIGYSCG
jgi:hypothetical protein